MRDENQADSARVTPAGTVRKFVLTMAAVSGAVGLIVLIGWQAHIRAMVQIRPGLPPMRYNASLCLVVSAAALAAFAFGRLRIAQIGGLLAATFSAWTFGEHSIHVQHGIDEFFFKHLVGGPISDAGRMADLSAISYFLTGAALLLACESSSSRWRQPVIGLIASAVCAICVMAIVGYIVALPETYRWKGLPGMAPHTAFGLACLALGVGATSWNVDREKDELFPRWFPGPVAFGGLVSTLVLWAALESHQADSIAELTRLTSVDVRAQILAFLQSHTHALSHMAHRWEFSGRPNQQAWEDDANNFLADFHDYQAIEWVDPTFHVRWVRPLEGNEQVLGRDLTQEARRQEAVNSAIESKQPVISQSVQLAQGGSGFLVYTPVFVRTNFDGLIVAVFRNEDFFDAAIKPQTTHDYSVSISSEGDELFRRNDSEIPMNAAWVKHATVNQPNVAWDIGIWPSPTLLSRLQTRLPSAVLGVGFILTAAVTLAVYFAQLARRQARKLGQALSEVKTLRGLMPICGVCKKIRDDRGYWNQIESFISKRTDASFSHGLCPKCAAQQYKAAGLAVPEKVRVAAENNRDT